MQNIEQQAIETYQNNISYFQEHHKELYEKINLLELAIENGQYQERYALEYKNNYFDITELSSNQTLYSEDSISYSQRIVDFNDFKRTGAMFKAQKKVFASDAQAEAIDQGELTFHSTLWATIKIINYVSKHASDQTHMNRVHKVIFLDVGLGLHLLGIMKKYNPQVIFIKEQNLETFRLSLFATDYKNLGINRLLYFSIADNEEEERKNFLNFLNKGNNYNLNIKHIPFSKEYAPQLQRLQSHVLSQVFIGYGYSAILLRYIDSPRYLAANYSFLNVNKFHHSPLLEEKPLLLLFSGPSTSNNMDWVKANQDRFIIVSPLSVCRLLHSENITPDIVIHIDPGKDTTTLLFEGFDTQEYFKDTMVILASNVAENTVSKFNPSNIHFVEQGTFYKKGFGRLSAPSVGEYSYALSLILGAKSLFLLGIDLALDSETLQSHGAHHPGQKVGTIDTKSASLDPGATIEYIRGNFLEKVPTFAKLRLSIDQLEIFSADLKRDEQCVYNLSNGAYLKGCEPLHIEDFDWNQLQNLDKTLIHQELRTFFNEIGESNFNEEDREQIAYQVKEAKRLEKLIKKHQKKKYLNAEAYLGTLAKLSWELGDMENRTHSNLAQVYYEYFLIILSYIFDLFNTKELKNPDKHVVQINLILVKQLLKMSDIYIKTLEGYLKK